MKTKKFRKVVYGNSYLCFIIFMLILFVAWAIFGVLEIGETRIQGVFVGAWSMLILTIISFILKDAIESRKVYWEEIK